MPISDKYKIIFIHIPKTAGTSIESFFEMTQPENLCFYRWDRDQRDFLKKINHLNYSSKINYEPQHYPLEILKKLIIDYDQYFKFSFVRNPYTKLLSEYYWHHNKQIQSVEEFDPNEFQNWCVTYLSILDNSHKEPQINFIDDSINFVGKYENIQIDFELLKDKLIAFSPQFNRIKNIELPYMNATGLNKELLIQYLLPETKQLIFNLYKSDFIEFSYSNEL